jgi:hypothetical protein
MTQIPNDRVDAFRWLTEGELDSFREDYRELEKEIQSFFRAYYISGLILVAAWLTGPQSKPLLELALGNAGYNIYAPIGIALLNIVSTISLIYKSISIHEVTQFAARYSKPDSATNYWERWRRSSENYAKFARPFYSPLLFMVPFGLSCLILIPTGKILYRQPGELLNEIKNYQVPASITGPSISSQPTKVAVNNLPNMEAGSDLAVQERERTARQALEDREAYATQIERIFWWARGWFWIIVGLHAVPLWLGLFNAFVIPKRWDRLTQPLQETGMDVVVAAPSPSNPPSESKQPSAGTARNSDPLRDLSRRGEQKKTGKDDRRTQKK